ncbi:MAG: ABC transporter permease [Cyclobacteriaceae bacterium]
MKIHAPKWAENFLKWYCHADLVEEIHGDAMELFQQRLATEGQTKARLKFVWDVIRFFRWSNMKIPYSNSSPTSLNSSMLSNYFKIIFRNLSKHKLYATINTLGLCIGILCFTLSFLYVSHEFSYENFHEKKDRIYRLTQHFEKDNTHWARINQDWTVKLADEIPEVETMIRFQSYHPRNIKIGERKFRQEYSYAVDSNVFDVFDFDLLIGNPRTALSRPFTVVITEKMAKTFFSDQNPIGKEIEIAPHDEGHFERYQVTGVMKDLPSNTHLPVKMLTSINGPEKRKGWAYTYLLLKPGVTHEILGEKIVTFRNIHCKWDGCDSMNLPLQQLSDIHLTSNLAREVIPNGDIFYVYIFIAVGLFVLIVAIINFMNLSSARSIERSKEVGIRKVLGSHKKQLITYFLCESLVFAFIASVFGFAVIHLALPYFNYITGIPLELNFFETLTILISVSFLTGICAGFYPAFILSSLKPIRVLKGSPQFYSKISTSKFSLNKALVSFQFTISHALIICTLVTYQQFSYLQNKKLGFSKEQIIALPHIPSTYKGSYQTFKTELLSYPGIKGVTACMETPSREIRDIGNVTIFGMDDESHRPTMDIQVVDTNFVEFMDSKIIAGTNIPTNIASQTFGKINSDLSNYHEYVKSVRRAYLINETAMRKIGWEKPEEAIGQQIDYKIGGLHLQKGPITGVVQDFHQESLKNAIDPLVMVYEPVWLNVYLVKIDPQNISNTLAHIEKRWNEFYPALSFEYSFLDDLFAALYQSERQQFQMLTLFSGLAIFVAFLGIFGLIGYSVKNRMKEIAIRKTLGASLESLLLLLGKDFIFLVIPAIVLAIPASWYAMNMWLEHFAYRVNLSPISFIASVVLLIGILLLVVFVQIKKSSNVNPANILRNE